MTLEMAADPQPDLPPVADDDQDSVLLVAAQRDPAAFAELYVRNADRLVAYFYRRTACAVTSHDLAAETFAQALASIHRYRATSTPGIAWIFGIANNLHRQWLRRSVVSDAARRKLQLVTPQLVSEDLERVEALVDFAPVRSSLRSALDELSGPVRDAVVLRVAQDLPYAEVAQVLGCSIGAARVRVSRGLDRLYQLMEEA